jgi:hypothetical protein
MLLGKMLAILNRKRITSQTRSTLKSDQSKLYEPTITTDRAQGHNIQDTPEFSTVRLRIDEPQLVRNLQVLSDWSPRKDLVQ